MLEKVRSYILEVRADKISQAQKDRYWGKKNDIIDEAVFGSSLKMRRSWKKEKELIKNYY